MWTDSLLHRRQGNPTLHLMARNYFRIVPTLVLNSSWSLEGSCLRDTRVGLQSDWESFSVDTYPVLEIIRQIQKKWCGSPCIFMSEIKNKIIVCQTHTVFGFISLVAFKMIHFHPKKHEIIVPSGIGVQKRPDSFKRLERFMLRLLLWNQMYFIVRDGPPVKCSPLTSCTLVFLPRNKTKGGKRKEKQHKSIIGMLCNLQLTLSLPDVSVQQRRLHDRKAFPLEQWSYAAPNKLHWWVHLCLSMSSLHSWHTCKPVITQGNGPENKNKLVLRLLGVFMASHHTTAFQRSQGSRKKKSPSGGTYDTEVQNIR